MPSDGPRLYFDHAATSFPKPVGVVEAMVDYARNLGASAGRGGYREALAAGEVVRSARHAVAALINAESPERIAFGLNCTDMLNAAIRGVLRPGDHAIASVMDHNSVLRPLHALRQHGVEVTLVGADAATGFIDAGEVRRAVQSNTRLIATQHVSNVTGVIQPAAELGQIARDCGAIFVLDAAQSLGHLPVDVRAMPVDVLAFPGHKGLLGPLGTGGMYVRPGQETRISPIKQGGTGSLSEQLDHPEFMPDRFESGSMNVLGLAGLCAGVRWILERGIKSIRSHDEALCTRMLAALERMPAITLHGPRDVARRVGVFSITTDAMDAAELSLLLESEFNVLTRGGLHCAALAHGAIGTASRGGTTRISFGPATGEAEVDMVAAALAAVVA